MEPTPVVYSSTILLFAPPRRGCTVAYRQRGLLFLFFYSTCRIRGLDGFEVLFFEDSRELDAHGFDLYGGAVAGDLDDGAFVVHEDTAFDLHAGVDAQFVFFHLHIGEAVEEAFDGLNFLVANDAGFAVPIDVVDDTVDGFHSPLFFFFDTNEDIAFEEGFLDSFFAVAPLAPDAVEGAVGVDALFFKNAGNLFLPAGTGVNGVPGFYRISHGKASLSLSHSVFVAEGKLPCIPSMRGTKSPRPPPEEGKASSQGLKGHGGFILFFALPGSTFVWPQGNGSLFSGVAIFVSLKTHPFARFPFCQPLPPLQGGDGAGWQWKRGSTYIRRPLFICFSGGQAKLIHPVITKASGLSLRSHQIFKVLKSFFFRVPTLPFLGSSCV